MPPPESRSPRSPSLLADPELRAALAAYVRARSAPDDVDDLVQSVLVEALASPHAPREAAALRPWLFGIARHEIVDAHRRRARAPLVDPADSAVATLESDEAPHEARSLARGAAARAGRSPEGLHTLRWLAREGDGDKLEAIAEEEAVPAATVRQRASRLRRLLREQWRVELALLAAIALVAGTLQWLDSGSEATRPLADHPAPAPSIAPEVARASALRTRAALLLEAGDAAAARAALDEARAIDPDGERAPSVVALRTELLRRAERAAPPASASVPTTSPFVPRAVPSAPTSVPPRRVVPPRVTPKPLPPPPKSGLGSKSGFGPKGK
jgi:DNA-directed RNA polymerase specialized sigma24 family protein